MLDDFVVLTKIARYLKQEGMAHATTRESRVRIQKAAVELLEAFEAEAKQGMEKELAQMTKVKHQ